MHDITVTLANMNSGALDTAIRGTLTAKYIGLSASIQPSGATIGPVIIHMDDTALPADDSAALALAAAHDPVFITSDKASIQANGTDAATITVMALKPGAAAVTLSVSVNGAAPTDWSFVLTGGAGSDTITALDAGTLTITVKNPANRFADQLIITAR